MKPSIKLGLHAHLTMTPQLRQAIHLLQLPLLDLRLEIQTLAESNPLISLEDIEFAEDSYAQLGNRDFRAKDSDYYGQALNQNPIPENLQDYLRAQMPWNHFNDLEQCIAIILIDAINEEGYLEISLEEVAHALEKAGFNGHVDDCERVLRAIQQYDPVGVGARTVSECLCIQVEAYWPDHPQKHILITLIKMHLEDLVPHRRLKLSQILQLPIALLNSLIDQISTLSPKPGLAIGFFKAHYAIPDAFITRENHSWQVRLNMQYLPRVRMDASYTKLAEQLKDSADGQYMRTCIQEARWLIKSLDHRNNTLYKVLCCLVATQSDYLLYGEEYMRPLTLQNIADQVQLHASTISRVTANKCVETPQGIIPLKAFFCSEVETVGGLTFSSTAIRALIKRWIETEDRTRPWTDSQLVNFLLQEGIVIARRTVAKYRELLRIAPSHIRRRS